jgi:hypothetical protein
LRGEIRILGGDHTLHVRAAVGVEQHRELRAARPVPGRQQQRRGDPALTGREDVRLAAGQAGLLRQRRDPRRRRRLFAVAQHAGHRAGLRQARADQHGGAARLPG